MTAVSVSGRQTPIVSLCFCELHQATFVRGCELPRINHGKSFSRIAADKPERSPRLACIGRERRGLLGQPPIPCSGRSRRFIADAGYINMKWNIAVALATGFVLAVALIFGGPAMNGSHLIKSDKEPVPNSSDCCPR
jgi:hypothetical protein